MLRVVEDEVREQDQVKLAEVGLCRAGGRGRLERFEQRIGW